MTKTYIGTKQVTAKPMTRLAYNEYRGWMLPADENGADAGFLIEYVDGGKPNHPDHAGYISWSPAGVFERAYKEVAPSVQQLIEDRASKAPRVTPQDVDDAIDMTHYFTAGQGCDRAGVPHHPALDLITFCVLALKNGFTVIGKSAVASVENYDKEIGERVALADAKAQIWPLLGFRLKDRQTIARQITGDANTAAYHARSLGAPYGG